MRRITLWALSTLSAVVLLFGYHTSTSGPGAPTATPAASGSYASSGSASTSSATRTPAGAGGGSGDDTSSDTTATPSGSPSAAVGASTVFVGSVAQTRWGPVQVQLTVAGGKVTRASVLEYPNGNGRDAEINSRALPILTQETVTAQSADIDMVSGATVTSDGYIESLQSALDQAGV